MSNVAAGQCRLHNVQFYNLLPRGINCLAVDPVQKKVALSRDDGTIEIWNLIAAPFLEKSIPGHENASVEALAWSESRLFSVGLSGSLIEWDLRQLKAKSSLLVTGNAAWCMDISKDGSKLAVGTEEGYINIYNVDNDQICYEKILDKQEGRVVCVRFDYTGDFLVTGSLDAVRIWDVKKGHAVHKMTIGRAERNKQTIVWDILVLKDFTIIAGDSRGKITIFEGHLGTAMDSIQVSKADVLCLTIDEQEKILYVGGVDPTLKLYQRVETTKADEKVKSFVRTLNRKCHTHDVKAMVMFSNQLISGGVDGSLIISSFPPFIVDKYLPILEPPSCTLTQKSRMILLKYVNYLEVWTLSSASIESQKILQIRSKCDEHIVAASISSDGKWVVYSSEDTIRLFRFQYDGNVQNSRLIPMRTVPQQFKPGYRMEFTHDSKGLFLFKHCGTIEYFVFTEEDDFDHKQTIEIGKWFSDKVHLTAISLDNCYMVCAGLCSAIIVFKREKFGKWKRLITLPKYKIPPTAIAIQPNSPIIAAVFPDHKIFHYDFSEFKFTFSSFLKLDRMGSSLKKVVSSVVFDPRNDDVMILQHDSALLLLQFEDGPVDVSQTKQQKYNTDKEDENLVPRKRYSLNILKTYARVVNTFWLGNDEMVVVEANPLSMVEHLPPAFRKKIYGTT